MSVQCSNCGDKTAKPVLCAECSEFSCEKCAIASSESTNCVKCFLKSLNIAERKMWTNVLKKKGVIKERVEDILNYLGSPVVEFTYTIIGDKKSCTIKTHGPKGVEYNRVSYDVFKGLWDKANRLGFEPKRIPFGERIIVTKETLPTKKA
ncbi:MAG: hypothetical protein V1836_00145 [Candidatus Aenigmatarchaeota archaeon]